MLLKKIKDTLNNFDKLYIVFQYMTFISFVIVSIKNTYLYYFENGNHEFVEIGAYFVIFSITMSFKLMKYRKFKYSVKSYTNYLIIFAIIYIVLSSFYFNPQLMAITLLFSIIGHCFIILIRLNDLHIIFEFISIYSNIKIPTNNLSLFNNKLFFSTNNIIFEFNYLNKNIYLNDYEINQNEFIRYCKENNKEFNTFKLDDLNLLKVLNY